MEESAANGGAPARLWQNRAFLRLWIAQLVSGVGSQITAVALPLTAVLLLGVTPGQMGVLGVATYLPNLVFGLFAGVCVDRARRRPVLVGADLGRAVLLGSIPIAALLGRLTFLHLCVVGFAAGSLTVFFEVAATSVLPALVARHQLLEANSRLAIGDAVLAIAGPAAAGGFIQLLSAPKAIIADAVSYVLSALSLGGIGKAETKPRPPAARAGVRTEIGAGVRALVRTPLLRALTLSSSAGSLFLGVQNTVLVLFLTRDLAFAPAVIGLAFASTGGGSLLGAACAAPVARRIGPGRAVILGTFLGSVGGLLVPCAGGSTPGLALVVAGRWVAGLGAAIYSVNQLSLRQLLTPPPLLGRVNAARRFLVFSTLPLGAGIGGWLGGVIGLRPTLFVGALGFVAALLLAFFSPVRHVRDVPPAVGL